MEYKYNLAKLQYDKEKMEELITRHNRRIGQVFPQKLEQEFWRLMTFFGLVFWLILFSPF